MSLFPEFAEGFLKKDAAQELVKPYAARFAKCWESAWRRWKKLPDTFRADLTPTTRAGILNNLAIAKAKRVFAPEIISGKFEFCRKLGFFKIYVEGKAIVRLKRLTKDYIAANVRTDQQRLWYAHKPIDGIKDGPTRLIIGYTLNALKTDFEQLVVSFQIEDVCVWYFDLDAGGGAAVQPIDLKPISPDTTPRVRPIGGKKAENNG